MWKSDFIKYLLLLFIFSFLSSCEKDISTTPEEQPPFTGKIVLNSDPQGAEIFLNGDNTGKLTPDSIVNLEPGKYYTMMRKYPYLDILDSVIVEDDIPKLVLSSFLGDTRNFGTIYIQSNPSGAAIFLRDSALNRVTPTTIENLWPGLYRISCSFPEHRDNKTYVLVRGGEHKSGFITLQDTTQFVDYNPIHSEFPSIQTISLEVDQDNYKWVGLPGTGLIRFKESEIIHYNVQNSELPNDYINCIAIDDQNNKWIGTPKGLVVISNTGTWTVYTKENSSIPHDYIRAIAFDNNGNIWLGATDPNIARLLLKFDGTNWTSYQAPNIIVSMAVDNANRLWVGLNIGFRLFVNETWLNIVPYLGESHHLTDNPIESIAVDIDGKVWVGAGGIGHGFTYISGGLYVFEGNSFERITLSENLISHIHITPTGTKWISCLGKYPLDDVADSRTTLIKISPDGQKTNYSKSTSDLPGNLLRHSSSDLNGNLWIATRDYGIIKFKKANW